MTNYPKLPSDIFSRIGIVFSNPTNRIFANQFPYELEKRTIYISDKNYLNIIANEIENNTKDTVLIVRNNDGELINSWFLPKDLDKNPVKRFLENAKSFDSRIPVYK